MCQKKDKKILAELEEVTAICPICSSKSHYWTTVEQSAYEMHRVTDKGYNKKTFHLYRCSRCGHGHHDPGVENQQELLKYYTQDYAKDYLPDKDNERFLQRREQYKLDLAVALPYLSEKEIFVLDFGCSVGEYLKAMLENWNKHGYEINKHEIEYLREQHKDITVYSDIEQIPENQFDLITFRGVIEHLYDFDDAFRLINKSIKPHAHIFVSATPDFNSPCAHVYVEQWNQICVPFHYHQFTAASLAILFAENGFGLKGLHYPYYETPYADFENDARYFISNVQHLYKGERIESSLHAYPGTMMSAVFQKVL